MVPDNKVLLRGARIVARDRVIEEGDLLIEDGSIARVLESPGRTIDGIATIDLQKLTLFPGFIDIHIHGAVGVDATEAKPDDLGRVAQFLARHGVTSWLPTLVPSTAEQYERAVRSIASIMSPGDTANKQGTGEVSPARVLGVHYEGPFVNSEQCGALHREYFRTFKTSDDLACIATLNRANAIHMMTLAPEVAGGIDLIRELKKRNWIVSIGHTRATAEVLDQALSAGAQHMTHFMNAMTPLHHRSLGAVGWGLIHDEVTCDVIADGIHIHPSILKLIWRAKGVAQLSLISDAIAATGLGNGEYHIWGETIEVKDGRTQNSGGSIAGSVITMLEAVRMMLSLGVSETDVARMASLSPARLLGIDRECGSIEEGKRADLVGLDDEQNVRLTVIGGRVAFQDSK